MVITKDRPERNKYLVKQKLDANQQTADKPAKRQPIAHSRCTGGG